MFWSSQVTSTKPGPIAPYLDVQSVVEAAKPGALDLFNDFLEDTKRCWKKGWKMLEDVRNI